MNEPKNSAKSEPPDADDEDDAATKLSELPADLMFDQDNAPFGVSATADEGVMEPAEEDVELVAPTAPPPRLGPPESVQIRAIGPAALSGDDIDVHGDTRLIQVPADPANAADNARAAAAAQGQPNAPAANPPPFGVYPSQQQQAYAPQQPQQQAYAPQQQHAEQPPHQSQGQYGQQQPQQQQPHGAPGQYEPASPFAATAYASPTNAPNPPPQRALAYAPTAPQPFNAGPPAPVAVQAKFAPPYAAPAGGGPASGIVWAIGGILVGLVLLGIIAFVLFWLLRGG
jgi:hypothetical protein